MPVDTANVPPAKKSSVCGTMFESPYRIETGLSTGATSTKLSTVPPGTPARRISAATGSAPSESTGSRMPSSQARSGPVGLPTPSSDRSRSAPTIARSSPAVRAPATRNGAAATTACTIRSTPLHSVVPKSANSPA